MFTAKLSRKNREFSYIPALPQHTHTHTHARTHARTHAPTHVHAFFHYQHSPPEGSITIDGPALAVTTQNPWFTLGFYLGGVHSMALAKCIVSYRILSLP